jgi:tetratricopeptide (TPR) repeat protein
VLTAEHLGRAADAEAAAAYLAAAQAPAGEYRHETALRLIEGGLRAQPNLAVRHALLCFRGEVLQDLGDVESSMSTFSEVVDSAAADTQRCDGWIGLAAGMRLSTRYRDGLELLARAEPISIQAGQTIRLSRLHHLRGNLYFSLGRRDECLDEHRAALEDARACASVEAEVQALGGLGDAEYACGHMRSARGHLLRCLEMCVQHGFGRVEVANRAQLGIARYYCGEWQ